jgi:hypothetical protein
MEKSGCPITMSRYLKPEMIDLYMEWLEDNPDAPLPDIPTRGTKGGKIYGAKRRQMGRPKGKKNKPKAKREPSKLKPKPKRSKPKKKVDYEAMFEGYVNKGLDEEDAIELVLKKMEKNGDEVHDFA